MGKRNGLIDFYRFIFSLVIVFHHAMWLDGVVDISTQVVFLGGYSAVEFFFIVSGLFLAKKAYSCQESNEVGKRTWHEIINRIKVSGAQQTAKVVYRKFFNQIGILPLVSGNSVF